jgi:hypothetical protein
MCDGRDEIGFVIGGFAGENQRGPHFGGEAEVNAPDLASLKAATVEGPSTLNQRPSTRGCYEADLDYRAIPEEPRRVDELG